MSLILATAVLIATACIVWAEAMNPATFTLRDYAKTAAAGVAIAAFVMLPHFIGW